jgi:hypothetical protein
MLFAAEGSGVSPWVCPWVGPWVGLTAANHVARPRGAYAKARWKGEFCNG